MFNWIFVRNIKDSVVRISVNIGKIARKEFVPSSKYFKRMHALFYDDEIKSKFIPELHQQTEFERTYLSQLLTYQKTIDNILNQIHRCKDYNKRFRESYRDFTQLLEAENILVKIPVHSNIQKVQALFNLVNDIESELKIHEEILARKDYTILNKKQKLSVSYETMGSISYSKSDWAELIDKEPSDHYPLQVLFKHFNQVQYEIDDLKRAYIYFKRSSSVMIIAGPAGTGKTHLSAYLVQKIQQNGDLVLFFKAKQFCGDNINLPDKLIELLQIPANHALPEVLEALDDYARSKKKRCFFIIDALNETTRGTVGFSNIWEHFLPTFINQVKTYDNLYLVCTLRNSYVDHIWQNCTERILEINGLDNHADLRQACEKYFEYYKIMTTNFGSADLSIFETPLLLDLYCKLINESRLTVQHISLDIGTYLQVFENYIFNLINQVKRALQLQQKKPIDDGFLQNAQRFYENNEAILSIDEFSASFDNDPLVRTENSIANAVLEGYLIFIRDSIGRREIVKHTQQHVGGYLLAKYLGEIYPVFTDLVSSKDFQEKIIGPDETKHHQLNIDILKFLIVMNPALITELTDINGLQLSWWYLYYGNNPNLPHAIPEYLVKNLTEFSDHNLITYVLETGLHYWFESGNPYNFHFIADILEKLDQWTYDITWTRYVYDNYSSISLAIVQETDEIKKTGTISEDHDIKLWNRFAMHVLSTTVRELRDETTIYFLHWGKHYPLQLLELTVKALDLKDSYIYERLVACCYGVSLMQQNNPGFVKEDFGKMASQLYDLQFSENSTKSVYNYIVLDSIKHLIDLAILKGVFELNGEQKRNLNNYQFTVPYEWRAPNKKQLNQINQANETHWPDPIGMDFGIYTIPRLIGSDYKKHRSTIANVYKNIFELGFQNEEWDREDPMTDFIHGVTPRRGEGKIDRLGKKYSWRALFEYAGVLLRANSLAVYENRPKGKYYDRLNDVDIDISLPSQSYHTVLRVYPHNLIINRQADPNWHKINKIDTIIPIMHQQFSGMDFTMLYGKIEERVDQKYDTRSFLLAETFFIEKNKYFEDVKQAISGKDFDWDFDIHFSPDHLSHTYFGELYWADNMPVPEEDYVTIPTGKKIIKSSKVSFEDILHINSPYTENDKGKIVETEVAERIGFMSEATLVDYLWESNSLAMKGYGEYYPSIKMGKDLGLISDTLTGQILASDLSECFKCVTYDEKGFENNVNYMRTDLLQEYMKKYNLAILYQVKQHSYDTNYRQNRQMKFFIKE